MPALAMNFVTFFYVVVLASVTTANIDHDDSSTFRLPKNIVPEFYDILLLTNVTRGDFDYQGETTIVLRVLEKTKRLVLHVDKLNVTSEKSVFRKFLTSNDEDDSYLEVPIQSQIYQDYAQFYVFNFNEELERGKYLLKLYFSGQVLDDVYGFYKSSYYRKNDNETRWIGVTQFSPTYARRAFPCMDEPGFKATFQLRVGHYDNETVTSNTFPESVEITEKPNYVVTKFKKTHRMPTYLFGWIIHDFGRVNVEPPLRFSLWTHLNDSEELPESLTSLLVGEQIYKALEEYTDLYDPLGKLEQFAIPDFNFKGMENWGMIAYRESVPLDGESQSTVKLVHEDIVTIAHEYSHSWFGNLVTPVFWDVAWLKEGFSTYFAYASMDMIHENWRAMSLFNLEVLQTSLLADSEDHNRTMNGRNVGSPRSAMAVLDFVTYDKGASIVRMISDVMGRESFRNAIRSYLKEYRYEAVTPFHFYKHLEPEFNTSTRTGANDPINIASFIETWTNQPNYPLIKTSRFGPRQILIAQQVFKFNHDKSMGNSTRTWSIPVTIAASTNNNQFVLVKNWLANVTKVINLPYENTWYVVNPEQIGYYRVDYDENNWRALKEILLSNRYDEISRVTRAGLLDDVFNLAKGEYQKYELALDLAKYLKRETEYEPWFVACRVFITLEKQLREKPNLQSIFRSYAIQLIKSIYEQLSFKENPSDTRVQKMQRNLILSTACSLNLVDCVTKATSIFKNWMNDEKNTVHSNLKDFIYRTGIINGSKDDWIKLWERFLKTNLYAEKEIMMKALACTTNFELIERYLEFSIQPSSNIKKQYRLFIFKSVISSSCDNIENILRYLDENLKKIIDLKGNQFLNDILMEIGKEVITRQQNNKLSLFITKNSQRLENSIDTCKKALKLAENNIKWIDNFSFQIENYFKNSNKNTIN